MGAKQEISEEFLRAFVKSLIINLLKQKNISEAKDIERIKRNITMYKSDKDDLIPSIGIKKDINDTLIQAKEDSLMKSIAEKEIKNDISNLMPFPNPFNSKAEAKKPFVPMPFPIKRPIPRPLMIPKRPIQPMPSRLPLFKKVVPAKPLVPKVIETKQVKQADPFEPSITEQKTEFGYPKIDQMLADPNVQTVECPGPNKQILIYKSGSIQTANLTLTNDEINNIMKNVSEKTRIPLMSGVFKAALGNLIVTAVMSEFVGTRFIVQKKPQNPPSPNQGY